MDIKNIDPNRDGYDYINVYSKAETQIGRDLTNFSHHPFLHPKLGQFASIEGMWFWTRLILLGKYCGAIIDGKKTNELKGLYGFKAKQLGKELCKTIPEDLWKDFPEETFRKTIKEGLRLKVESYHNIQKGLMKTTLPLVHFYVYGSGDKKVVREAGHQWIIDYLEELRHELFMVYSTAFVYRLYHNKGETVECIAWVDKSDNISEHLNNFRALYRMAKEHAGKPIDIEMLEAAHKVISANEVTTDDKVEAWFKDKFCTEINETLCFKDVTELEVVQDNGVLVWSSVIQDNNNSI